MFLPQLTFTRFIASISIVILHFGLYSYPITSRFIQPFTGSLIGAMSYFFFLSGFVMVLSISKDHTLPENVNTIAFWRRRAARILPVYLLALFVFFFINFSYDPSIPLKWQIQSYYHSLFLIQSWKYKMALDVNYPSWSLSVEAFFYFIFPWLYFNLKRLKNKSLIWVSIIAWALNIYVFIALKEEGVPESFIKFFPLLHVATFINGICLAMLFIKKRNWFNERRTILLHGLAISAILFMAYTSYKNYAFYKYQHNGLLAPFYGLIILSLSLLKGKLKGLLASKPLTYLGEISFSVYILQYPVYQICQKYLPYTKELSPENMFLPYVGILLVISALVYTYFEKPMKTLLSPKRK